MLKTTAVQVLIDGPVYLATVLVERKSQKGILIGKGGAMLKTIGQGRRGCRCRC